MDKHMGRPRGTSARGSVTQQRVDCIDYTGYGMQAPPHRTFLELLREGLAAPDLLARLRNLGLDDVEGGWLYGGDEDGLVLERDVNVLDACAVPAEGESM